MTIEEDILEETRVERGVADVLESLEHLHPLVQRRVLIRAIARLDVGSAIRPEPTDEPSEAKETIASRILAILAETPRLPMRRMATAVYGSCEPRRVGNVRAQLHALKAKGLVRTVQRGEWELGRAEI